LALVPEGDIDSQMSEGVKGMVVPNLTYEPLAKQGFKDIIQISQFVELVSCLKNVSMKIVI
jgi:hypothetical protein